MLAREKSQREEGRQIGSREREEETDVAPNSPEQGKRGERIELVSQEGEKNWCAAGMMRGGKVSCLRGARV
jgi:hypothetical protein